MPAALPYSISNDAGGGPEGGDVSVVALNGDIDIAINDHLKAAIETTLAARPEAVVVDFAEVEFMDSTGLRFLVGFKTGCDAIGAAWTLRAVPASVQRLIEISGLTDFLVPAG